MKKGYTRSWRKEIDSEVWSMPPLYHRVFYWLRQKASWRIMLVPTRNGMGIWLTPGMVVTSLDAVARGVAYREWGVERVPNRKTVRDVLEWLERKGMVRLAATPLGTAVSIANWDVYQAREDEEANGAVSALLAPVKGRKREAVKEANRVSTKNASTKKDSWTRKEEKKDGSRNEDPYAHLYIRLAG